MVDCFFVGDGLARPVTINKSRIVRRGAVVTDAQCAPLLFKCLFVGATALACSVVRCAAVCVYFRDEQARPLQRLCDFC